MSKTFDVPWGAKEASLVYLAAWIGLPFLLAAGLALLGPSLPPAANLLHGIMRGDVTPSFVFLVLDGLAALGLVWYLLRRHRASWKDVGYRPFNLFRAALLIAGLGMFFVVFSNLLLSVLQLIFHGFNANQPQVNEFTRSSGSKLSLLALVVIPPFIEETVFRGFIFPALADKFGLVIGILSSSILFAVAHWQLNVSIYTFVLGCLLAIMYWRTRSVWPGIILHMLNNYLAFMVILNK